MGDSKGKTNNTQYQKDGEVQEKGMTELSPTRVGWGVWVVRKRKKEINKERRDM
jgi:hypothetical protein